MKNARFLQVFFNLFHGLMAGLITSILLLVPLPANSQYWNSLGPNDFDQLSYSYAYYIHATKGPGQSLYLVFQDQSSGNKAMARKYVNGTWTKLGTEAISTGVATYTDIAVNSQGIPYVIYRDAAAGYKATVKKFTGSGWETVGTEGPSLAGAYYTRIAIAPDGTPYVVFADEAEGYKTTVKKFNGSSWVAVGMAGFSIGLAYWTSIAIGSDGIPLVTYSDFGGGSKAAVKKFDGTAWVNAGISSWLSAGKADYTEIALSSDNTPYVMYSDVAEGSKATVKRLNGSSWSTVGQSGFSDAAISAASIAISPNDDVYTAYNDWGNGHNGTVKSFIAGQWVTVGVEGFAFLNSQDFGNVSIVSSSNNSVCLAYGNWKANVTCFEGGTWVNTNTMGITEGLTDLYRISAGNNNLPYITFFYGGLTDPWYIPIMFYSFPSWTLLPTLPTILPEILTQVPVDLEITSDANDLLYIAYWGLALDSTSSSGHKGIAQVLYYNGIEWTSLGNPELFYKNISQFEFVLDKTGTPYLACTYYDYDQMYKFAVTRFNGSEWEPLGEVLSASDISHFKLAFSSNNTPYIAYRKYSTNKITIKKLNATEWATIGEEDFVSSLSGGGSNPTLDFAVAAEDTPYLLYADANDYMIHLLQYDGSQWKQLGDTISPFKPYYFALALAGNTPYIVFDDQADKNKGVVKKWDGQGWTTLGGTHFSCDRIWYPSIFVTSDRTVLVAYGSSVINDLFVKSYEDECTAPANINGPDTVAFNQTAMFSAPAGFTGYTWNASSGVVLNGQGTAHAQISFPVSGNIIVSITVTDSNGCTGTAMQNVHVPGVISTHTPLSPDVQIASNPFSDVLRFEVFHPAGTVYGISISDAVSRTWWEQAETREGAYYIETASWPPGTYFLQIKSGRTTATWRVVKM